MLQLLISQTPITSMSFYFNVSSEKTITYSELIGKLKLKNIQLDPLDNLNEFIGEHNYKLFIPNKSTRGVNLYYRERSYSIGLNVISSDADFELGLHLAETISELTQAPILPEDREDPIDINTFKKEYDKAWIEREKYLGVNIFMEKIGAEGNTLSIGCCYMMYMIGPKIHEKLDKSSERSYYNGLVNHICATQFWNKEIYLTPNILQVTNKDGGEKKELIVLYPNGNQFLRKADVLVIPYGDKRLELPFERIGEIASEKFHLVDEEQYLVDQLTDEEYRNVCLKAAEVLNEKKQKPWWKFGR